MSAFIDGTFAVTVDSVAVVGESFGTFFPRRFGTVVTGEDDHRILGKLFFVQHVEDPTHMPIGFHHEITIRARLTFATELVQWNDRLVGRRIWQIQEEWLALARCRRPSTDPVDGFVCESCQAF